MGNTAVGGNGGVGNMLMAPNGQGIGPDLFMMSGSTVTFNLTNDLIINSVIASDNGAGGGAINTGGITKTGTATLTLGGANTYTGITSINGGTLSISNDGNLGELTNPISFDGGTLHVTGAPFGTGRDVELVGDGTIDIIDGGGFLIAGVISGVGSLTKTNTTGTLVFQGANTYSSTTTISKGVLGANAADTFSPNSAVVLSDVLGAVLDLNDFDNTILSLSGGGPAGGNVMLGTATLKTGDATDTTYSGVISETGNLIKQGSGIFTLSGVNTYTGTTTVSEGTLALFEEGDISASSEVILSAMTTFDISEVTNGATIKDLNGAVGSELVLGAKTLTLGTSTASTTFSGLISGMGGSLIKNGSGTII
jgi:autotransporter-associated beta strand protein